MSIKFQYNGYLVECDTPDEARALMKESVQAPTAGARQINRVTPNQPTVGQERYRSYLNDLSEHPRKVVITIAGQVQISMDDLAKAVGTDNNMSLSSWITTALRMAQKHGIQAEQLWKKEGSRGTAKFMPTPAFRAAVESLRDSKISAVKQTA
jgi:hypothetical protein